MSVILEAQLLDRVADRRHVALVVAVDQDVALRRGDQKRSEGSGADVIEVADDLVRRERRVLIFTRADVAPEQLVGSPDFRGLRDRHGGADPGQQDGQQCRV